MKSYAVVPDDYSDEYLKPGDRLRIVWNTGEYAIVAAPVGHKDAFWRINLLSSSRLNGGSWLIDTGIEEPEEEIKPVTIFAHEEKPDILSITRGMFES